MNKRAKLLALELSVFGSGDGANHIGADLVAHRIGSRKLLVISTGVQPGKEREESLAYIQGDLASSRRSDVSRSGSRRRLLREENA